MAEPRHRPDEVAARSFPTTFRGFDPSEVRRYLASVAAALSAAADREVALREELARAKASLARPEIDESVLMAALGEETTRVLVAARAAATDIRVSADENAAQTLLRAHEEAEALRAAARSEADAMTRTAEGLLAARTREADDAAAQMMIAAGEEAERIRCAGLEEARALVSEARAVRERMLEDLRQRVRRAEASFTALQLGRDRVLEALGSVRDALDEAADGLATAEARARAEAEPAAAQAGDAAAAAVDEIATLLREPSAPRLEERTPVPAEQRILEAAQAGAEAAEAAEPEAIEPAAETGPEAETETETEAAADAEPGPAGLEEAPAAHAEPEEPVHTGDPSGPVAAVVPIGAVFQEHDEDELTPTHDAPASAPTTGEVPVVAATGTDTYTADRRSRRSRRALRLAGDPSVRAEEQRLASMRYLHRPRTGSEPDVHLPEDGMVVVEPPSADEAVRVVGRDGPPAPRSPASAPSGHAGPDEPAVTVLGPVATTPLPTRRPPGAGGPGPGVARAGGDAPRDGDRDAVEPDEQQQHGAEAAAELSPEPDPPAAADTAAELGHGGEASGDLEAAASPPEADRHAESTAAPNSAEKGDDAGPAPVPDVQPEAEAAATAPVPSPGAHDAGSAPVPDVQAAEAAPAAPAKTSDVDDLFARLRASQEQHAAGTPAASPEADTTDDPPAGPHEAPAAVAPPAGAPTEPTGAAASAPQAGDEAALQGRDAATGPLEAQLAKMVKRLLSDHQNAVLEKLRSRRRPPAVELLSAVEDLVRPLAAAAEPLLARAADAGYRSITPDVADDAVPPVADLAGDVAANIVRDLRPRLETAFGNDGESEVSDGVGIAFREWRGERVSRLVGDALHVAYTRGCYVAAPKAARLRWVADDGEQPCPDCDDNALAGGLRKGKAFPTGHRHPPAHTGCRCIIVRA